MNGRLLVVVLSWAVVAGGFALVAGAESRPWGDWVVAGDDADAGASILLRRITPKSVFVAPTFTGCSEGYRQDSLGRCVKLVKVNQQSQWNFILERLNSMYSPTSTSKKPQKESGPFHINLPLASQNPQEDSVVNKRQPPQVAEVKTTQTTSSTTTTTLAPTTTTTTTTTTPPPQTSTWPVTTTTTMSDSTTAEVPLSTVVEPSEVTSTDKDVTSSSDATAEPRRDTTTESLDIAVMLGDQPYEETEDKPFDTPKSKEKISQLQEKPFLIIVTNPTVTRSEFTSTFLPTEGEVDGTSTAETTTEGNTKYTTETSTRSDETFGETRDVTEISTRPAVTTRPDCEDSGAFDCEPIETEVISEDSGPSSLPELPLLDPSSQVRFPSESFVPVRKTQSFVRFPDVANPHEDRPAFWWPSWQIRQYPGIHGWPETSEQIHGSTDRVVLRKYPYGTTWSGTMAWQRRFLQRD